LGIALASYAEETLDAPEREQIAGLVADRTKSPWVTIESAAAREFDVVIFRRAGLESHVGIVIEPGRMLHIVKPNTESYVDSFASGRWKTKFVACHRHERRT
jgi:cell wall-associated NlpC family hydrolase